MPASHTLDQLDVAFEDSQAVANAGLLLPATLAERLGIQANGRPVWSTIVTLLVPTVPAASC